jgi:predicted transcriptional regulator
MPTYTFSADLKTMQRIDGIAADGDTTRSRIIRGLLREFVKQDERWTDLFNQKERQFETPRERISTSEQGPR